jgi:hypothetical protein
MANIDIWLDSIIIIINFDHSSGIGKPCVLVVFWSIRSYRDV